jgi:DNA-binding MarR family transcriptional regulator
MEPERRPIGYWLKHLDGLIERAFEGALGAAGLTRRHWQVLNTIASESATSGAVAKALQPFVGDDVSAINSIVHDLVGRGWVRKQADGRYAISDKGRAAHATAMNRVAETRNLLRQGITDDEYITLVRILQRMASNLESASASRAGGADQAHSETQDASCQK